MKCQVCNSEFALPRQAAEERHYSYEKPCVRWGFYEVIDYLKKSKIKEGVLDIGCGTGAFIKLLLQARISGEGIDFNREDIKKAQSDNLPCYQADFRSWHPERGYYCITAFHLIEHVEDPLFFLKKKRSLLDDNKSLLFVSFPNMERYSLHFGRELWDYPPNHLQRISNKGLQILVDRAGFAIKWKKVEPYKARWLAETSRIVYKILERFQLWNTVNSFPWLRYPIKLFLCLLYLVVQPYIWYWRLKPGEKQGDTVLYCLAPVTLGGQ